MGRPTKFSDDVARTICDAVRRGNFLVTAAAYAGVDADTVYLWLQQGQKPGAPREKREFFGALTRARAEAELAAVEAVFADMRGGALVKEVEMFEDGGRVERQFTPPNGTVALKFLQRAYPDRWADRKPIDPTGGEEGVHVVNPAVITALTERLHAEFHPELPGDADTVDAELVEDE